MGGCICGRVADVTLQTWADVCARVQSLEAQLYVLLAVALYTW